MTGHDQFAAEIEDCSNDAALFALGGLSAADSAKVAERLRGGCSFCCAQVAQYAIVAEHLSLSVVPVDPPPSLRQRVLESIAAQRMTVVRRTESQWIKMPQPGVEMRFLQGESTLMVRMQPDAVFPKHEHPHAEQCLVLDGSITDSDGTTLHAGDFVVMPRGTTHNPIHSKTGCTLFINYTD